MFSIMSDKGEEKENIFSSKPLPAINERVKILVEHYAKGSVKRFSEIINLSSSQKLNRVFNLDKRNNEYPEVSSDILLSIANMLSDINTEWLLTGNGTMSKTSRSVEPTHTHITHSSNNKDNETEEYKQQVHPEIVDKLLATIQEQAKEIGKLEQTITQLRRELGDAVSAANGSTIASVG